LTGAARIVLRDWSVGKFSRYTTPPSTANTTPDSAESSQSQISKAENEAFIAQLYVKEESILAALPTRKERRKAGGLVKFSSGVLEGRQTDIEEGWAGLEDSEGEESGEDESADFDAEGMDVDEEEETEEQERESSGDEKQESDEEEAEERPSPPSSNKQKRKRVLEISESKRPSKKVAFAPLSSKRPQAGSKRADNGDIITEGRHIPIKAAQQKALKSAQAPSKKFDGIPIPVSTVQAASKAKTSAPNVSSSNSAVKTLLADKGKVAKASSKTKAKGPLAPTVKKDANGPEAYDFGKFF